ncbi:MAG: tetratricopeptide repeat protein [Ignavibacteriaceae bacterium]
MKLSDRKINLVNSGIIIISLILIYSNSFNNSFNWDDTYLIQNNPRIEKIENYILTDSWFRIFNNRSLSLLSFALNYQLNGLDEFGYHLYNLIVHILASLTLYFLSLLLIKSLSENKILAPPRQYYFALLTALIFALHPLQTDAVTYITQRMASMAGFFVLLSTYSYSRFRISPSSIRKYLWISLTAFSFAAGFLSKETGLTAFFTIILVEFFFFRNISGKTGNKYLLVLLALLIIPPIIYLSVNAFPFLTREHTFSEYFFTQQKVILQYIGLLIYPLNQHLAHMVVPEPDFLSFSVIVPMFIHFALIALAIFLASRHKIISFAVLWFYMALLLESSFIPLPYFMNEYRIYVSMAGFAWIIIYTALFFVNKTKKNYPLYPVVLLIILLGFLTWQRNFVWRNSITLWTDNIEKSQENFEAHNALGYSYYLKGNYYKALEVLNRAVELKPDYINANLNRGTVLSDLNLDSLALIDFENVLKKDSKNYFALANKGVILVRRGNMELAKDFFILSLKSNPIYYRSHYNLGMYYQTKNNLDSSYYYYSQSIRHNPRFWGAYNNRAVILLEKKKYAESLKDLQKAISLRPFYIDAYINLAIVYRDTGDFDNAIQNHNYSLTINPRSEEALYQRSITLLKMNRKDLAQKDLEAILVISPNNPRAISILLQLKNSY